MPTIIQQPAPDIGVSIGAAGPVRYVDWGSILGGAFVAAAISSLFLTFGSAIGLSLTSVERGETTSVTVLAILTGLWLLWVQVTSAIGGGYFAGRMRARVGDATPHEVEMRDGAHGLLVWAVGVVAIAAATALTAGWLTTLGVAGAASFAGQAANSGTVDYYVDRLLRKDTPSEQGAGTDQPAATQAGQQAQAFTPSQQQPQQMARILNMSGKRVGLGDADRSYLVQQVAMATGLAPAEAEKRVDETVATLKANAERARKAGILFAFITAASLLCGAAASWWAAVTGGRHRNEDTNHRHFTSWR
jgi:hypothetical protein